MAADRKLLGVIKGLENMYKGKRRNFRNYDVQKYVSYRRLLHNHKALSSADVGKYYAASIELSKKNPVVEDDFKASPRVEAYYAVATKQYAKAVPLLRKAMETSNPGNLQFRRSMLEMIIEAARGLTTAMPWRLRSRNMMR